MPAEAGAPLPALLCWRSFAGAPLLAVFVGAFLLGAFLPALLT
jgi:hypothetical protein